MQSVGLHGIMAALLKSQKKPHVNGVGLIVLKDQRISGK